MKTKCLEYYFNSFECTKEDLKENIKRTKKEFPNKELSYEITLNDWGVYVITYYFENKNNLLQKVKTKPSKPKKKKTGKTRLEQYYGSRTYGQYKKTKKYKPY